MPMTFSFANNFGVIIFAFYLLVEVIDSMKIAVGDIIWCCHMIPAKADKYCANYAEQILMEFSLHP